MKINVLGGGPAGLYFAILMKRQDPAHEVTVFERDGPNDTFGWGIVFSDRTYSFLAEHDPESHKAITAASVAWDNVNVVHRGETVTVRGNNFCGVGRLAFLNALHDRCRALGVDLRFHHPVTRVDDLPPCELLVGADGANSLLRRAYADFFQPSIDIRQNRYIWLGTPRLFHGLTLTFRPAQAGLFISHSYQFSADRSTFIVECSPQTWDQAGFGQMTPDETCRALEAIFREDLGGAPLLSNNFVKWVNFPLVRNRNWLYKEMVLIGDALHTAHFSIGSGTKLALEDAIALAGAFSRSEGVAAALREFERARRPVVERFQAAALRSLAWLENVQEHLRLEPVPFAYRLMTRSQRVGYKRIRRGDPEFIQRYDDWRRQRPAGGPVPEDYLDLFHKKTLGHLATLMPDGTPHVTTVWVDYDGRHILINSARGRQKDRNMIERPDVALQMPDPDNSDRFLAVRGRVVEITEAGADEHLDRLSARYLEKEKYPPSMRFPGEVRCLYKIEPRHVSAWNPFG
jgi:anthraniloyl-CoA monooxygenase